MILVIFVGEMPVEETRAITTGILHELVTLNHRTALQRLTTFVTFPNISDILAVACATILHKRCIEVGTGVSQGPRVGGVSQPHGKSERRPVRVCWSIEGASDRKGSLPQHQHQTLTNVPWLPSPSPGQRASACWAGVRRVPRGGWAKHRTFPVPARLAPVPWDAILHIRGRAAGGDALRVLNALLAGYWGT